MTSSNSPFSCLSVLTASFQRCEPAWPLVLTPNSSSILLLLLDFHSLLLLCCTLPRYEIPFKCPIVKTDSSHGVNLFLPPLPDLASMPQPFSCLTVLFHSLFLPGNSICCCSKNPSLLQLHCVLQLRNTVRPKIRNQ